MFAAHLVPPELHNILLVAGGLRGLDAAAVEVGVVGVRPLLQGVDRHLAAQPLHQDTVDARQLEGVGFILGKFYS